MKFKRPEIEIPQAPGYYLWYILDLGYVNVGLVNIVQDTAEHLAWLKNREHKCYIYQNEKGDTLTMYHQAHDHIPYLFAENKPNVDGYVPFDWGLVKYVDN